MNKEKIVLEIPHRLPATAWVAYDGDDSIIEMAHHRGDESGCCNYDSHLKEDLIDCYGEDDIPDDAQKIINDDEIVYEINGEYFSKSDAITEIEWAMDVLGHDLSSFQVLENDDDLLWCLENLRHQRDKAEVALSKCRALVEWESKK